MKKFKGFLRIFLLALVSLILGLKFYSWNARTLVGNALPMPCGYGMAVVLSGSMEPSLKVNDLLIVHEADNYKKGDVVVYQRGYELIVHRIISIDEDKIITQGDANNTADEPITQNDIKGRVCLHIPFVGLIINFIKTPVGIILILGAAFALTELSFRKKKESDEKDIEAIKEEIRRLKEESDTKSEGKE